MTDEIISENLHIALEKLCDNLHIFLTKTETSLSLSQNRFEQVKYILQPWNLKNETLTDPFEDLKCTCTSSSTNQNIINDENKELLDSISKTLTSAHTLRSKLSKTENKSSKYSIKTIKNPIKSTKTSQTSIKNKSQHTLTTKPVSKQTINTSKDGGNSHYPSCPLYKNSETIEKKSTLTLSEAVFNSKIPLNLSKTVKQCYTFLHTFESGENLTVKEKSNFVKLLELENDKTALKFEKKYSAGDTFMKYLSTLNSCKIKVSKNDDKNLDISWFFYKNISEIQNFQNTQTKIINKQSWHFILQYIIENILPTLQNNQLTIEQKLYLQKILKTICNFTKSTIPRVPIFRYNLP